MIYKFERCVLVVIMFLGAMWASNVYAMDIYADAYRDSEDTATEKVGVQGDRYNFTLDFKNSAIALGNRHYLSFTNIELGLLTEVTTYKDNAAKDYRVAEITDNAYFQYTPYLKVGSKLFATIMYDTTDSWVIRVGFQLF